MTRSIQSLAAQAGREARANGLPCGEHTYTNKCADQEAYRSIEAMIPAAEYRARQEARWRAQWDKNRAILLASGIECGEYKPYYKD